MFGFIDSASDHAAALSHFHSYALFFLILVIVFVMWLLKMILKFSILERDLLNTTLRSISIFGFKVFFYRPLTALFIMFINLMPADSKIRAALFQNFFDVNFAFLSIFNAGKNVHSYGLTPTMYPDQGNRINVFSNFPQLVSTELDYRRPYSAGYLLKHYLSNRSATTTSLLTIFRNSLHNVPFLFPYERIDVKFYGPFKSVDSFIKLHVYSAGYLVFLKNAVWADYLKNVSTELSFKMLNTKQLFGFSDARNDFVYKTYSAYVSPIELFVNFYGSEIRMFFYLFFQHVRHRKVLEWVWTCLPAFILLFLLYPSLVLLYCYDRPYITRPYLTFKAIGHQWYWSYEYSDYVTSSATETREHIKFDSYMVHQDDLPFGQFRLLEVDRRIVLPIGVCMRLVTTSSDVLHSWAVPALGVKIDAVPGRLNQFWIVADRAGTFYGQCSELCGVNHGFMPIAVECTVFTSFFKALLAAEKL